MPARQFYDAAAFPWAQALEARTDAIRREALAALSRRGSFEPYLNATAERAQNEHHAMAGNEDWGAFYLWRDGELVEENAARCPETMAALGDVPLTRVPGRLPSVLFSLLRPGAHIPPHTGFVNTRLICHLPLVVPAGCAFRVGNEVREWREGELMIFDDTIEHEAWNRSASDRLVLLFDVWQPALSETERRQVSALLAAISAYGTSRSS
nr:aspartyl/asparaginyl beta-hydroxylase domain-containing protein [Parvularcula dongshanensis]